MTSLTGRLTTKDKITVDEHVQSVKEDEPKIAVAPDINGERSADYTVADTLLNHAENVVVVPKSISAIDVPDRFRVGVPCQKRFGPVPVRPIWEYQQCTELHLLGGSPLVHSEIIDLVGHDRVVSLDTASPIAASGSGKVWGRPFKNTEWYPDPHSGYYKRIEKSLNNLLQHHNENVNNERIEWIKNAVSIPTELEIDPLTYTREFPPDKEELCLGADDEVPFPGRAYFYQDDALSYDEWKERYR